MAKFFALTEGYDYIPKNKMQEEIQELFQKNDRCIVQDDHKAADKILGGINEIWKKHPRCKDPRVEIWKDSILDYLVIQVFGVTKMVFYPIRDPQESILTSPD